MALPTVDVESVSVTSEQQSYLSRVHAVEVLVSLMAMVLQSILFVSFIETTIRRHHTGRHHKGLANCILFRIVRQVLAVLSAPVYYFPPIKIRR